MAEANAAGADDARDDHASLLSILVGFVLLVGLGTGLWFLWQSTDVEDVALPDLSGRTFEELGPLIAGNDWEVVVLEGRENGSSPGEVISQSPAVGTLLERGDEVRVTLSVGNEMVTIPTELTGLGVEEARLRLSAVGLTVGDTSNVPSETVPVGGIVRVDEAGFELPQGEDVDLVLSGGPVPRFIPDGLVGVNVTEAQEAILALRLTPEIVSDFSYEVPIDIVMQISPEPGTEVEVGAAVGLFVSLGPEPIEVPDLIDLELGEATAALEAILLCVDRVDGRTTPDALVIATEPPAGDFVTDPTDCIRIVTSTAGADDE